MPVSEDWASVIPVSDLLPSLSSVEAGGYSSAMGAASGLRNATVIISTRIPARDVTPARRKLSLVLEGRRFLRLLFMALLSKSVFYLSDFVFQLGSLFLELLINIGFVKDAAYLALDVGKLFLHLIFNI